MRKTGKIWGACLLACFGILAAPARADVTAGKPAPALVIRDLKGKTFDLQAVRGKWAVVNFWATWCAPCRAEMPVLDAFYRKHRGNDFAMIGLSVDGAHDTDAVKKAAQMVSYPVALFADADKSGFGQPDVLPETVVVRPDGTVGKIFSGGGLTAERLAAVLHARKAK
ncbi:MAG: TlpA family protein disulfide reductase [Alphaproteobacteria bacterium]|nr:TlpA family protein disulfide reductase [Alphaproteobacteria bacterium]MDE2336688.1 TlpA family protein disulfide reductase [Alphaproteobacteria bacterium]